MIILRDEFKIILRKRFHYLFDVNSNSVYLAATYLDPNFKSMSFIEDDDERETNRDRARKFIASVSSRLVCLDREKEVERTASIHSTPQSSAQSSSVVSIGSSSSSASSASSSSSSVGLNKTPSTSYVSRRDKLRLNSGFLGQLSKNSSHQIILTCDRDLNNELRVTKRDGRRRDNVRSNQEAT